MMRICLKFILFISSFVRIIIKKKFTGKHYQSFQYKPFSLQYVGDAKVCTFIIKYVWLKQVVNSKHTNNSNNDDNNDNKNSILLLQQITKEREREREREINRQRNRI